MLTNEKVINKLEKIVTSTVKVFFAIIILILCLYSIVGNATIDAKEHTTFSNDNIFVNLIAILLICGLAVLLKIKKIKISKPVLCISFVAWFALCIFFIFFTKLQPKYDQQHVLDIAFKIKNGDTSFFFKRFIL